MQGKGDPFSLSVGRKRINEPSIYQLKLASTSCVQLETPLMIIPHIWSLLGRESWSRWIPQGKTRMLFVSGSIIHSLVLDFPQQKCHLGCGDRRLAVRAELDKSPCRRCVWNHFGKAAPPLCPDSCLWSSSLLQEVLQGREVCVLLPLLAPTTLLCSQSPDLGNAKGHKFHSQVKSPEKTQTCCGAAMAWLGRHQDSL